MGNVLTISTLAHFLISTLYHRCLFRNVIPPLLSVYILDLEVWINPANPQLLPCSQNFVSFFF